MRIVRTLGSGASGVVQKAFLPRESRFVAVKKISVLERDKRHQLMNDIKALCNAPLMDGLIRFFGAYHAADRGQARAAAARAAASCSAAQRTPPRCMPPLPRMLRLNRISATG